MFMKPFEYSLHSAIKKTTTIMFVVYIVARYYSTNVIYTDLKDLPLSHYGILSISFNAQIAELMYSLSQMLNDVLVLDQSQ